MTTPDKLREIAERNKRGQGSHVQKEDIAWLLAEIERERIDLINRNKELSEAVQAREELQKRCAEQQELLKQKGYLNEVWERNQQIKELTAKLKAHEEVVEALRKAQEDLNWVHNNRKFLNSDFSYIDAALAREEGQ